MLLITYEDSGELKLKDVILNSNERANIKSN